MEEKTRRLAEWLKGRKAPPFTLDINPTDRCNLRCIHCWRRAFEKIDSGYELSDKKLLGIVGDAVKLGVEEFEITGGGEPLMRKELTLKIMELVKRNKKFGNITTNGTLFELEDVRRIVGIGWDRVTFSLDGPDAKTNDSVRGRKTFAQVVKSINMFNRAKKEMKSILPKLKLNVVVNRNNYNKLDQMVELAKKMNCSVIHFDSLTVHSKYGEGLKLRKGQGEEFEKNARIAWSLAENLGIQTDLNLLASEFLEKSNEMEDILEKESGSKDFASLVCYEPWWHLVIKTNGFAQPCCLYDEKCESVKNRSLKQIWFGDFFEKIRREIANKQFSKYCSICNAGQVFENRRIRQEMIRWMKR